MDGCAHHEIVKQHLDEGIYFRDMAIRHESEIKNIQETLKDWKDDLKQIKLLIIGSFLTILISLCSSFFWAGSLDKSVSILTSQIEKHITFNQK